MRIEGDRFELSLPASFVRTAKLPLLLDPLLGSLVNTVDLGYSVAEPDIAYGPHGVAGPFTPAPNSFGLAFERRWSSADVDIYFALLNAKGAILGSPKILEGSSLPISALPAVGYGRANAQYLVAWEQTSTAGGQTDVYCRQIQTSGSMTATVAIASSTANESRPQLASDPNTSDDEILVVYQVPLGIEAAQITLSATAAPFVFDKTAIAGDFDLITTSPQISASGGSVGHFLITWVQRTITQDNSDIAYRLVDSNLTLLGQEQWVFLNGPDDTKPRVDGDGQTFLIAFERGTSASDLLHDIEALRVEYDLAGNLLSQTSLSIDVDLERDRNPAVAFAGNRFYVAWEDSYNSVGYHIAYVSLDADAKSLCSTKELIAPTGDTNTFPEFAPHVAGGGSAGFADLVFQRKETSASLPKIVFQPIGAKLGLVTSLGGGCGTGGNLQTVGDALVGSPQFQLSLSGADPLALAGIYNVNVPGTPIACGGCSLTPFFLVGVTPIVNGVATKSLPIPCKPNLAGAIIEMQWTVLSTAASPCPLFANLGFSDRVQLTIGS